MQFFSKISQTPGPSPLIITACFAAAVIYCTLPLVKFILFIAAIFTAVACIVVLVFRTLFRLMHPLYIRICLAAALGIFTGFFAVSGMEIFSPGIPPETVSALKGKLLDDPRSFSVSGAGNTLSAGEERGMALMELSQSENSSGTVRCSAKGRVQVFFPSGTMPRLRSFGRGSELYVEGSFLSDAGAANSNQAFRRFRATSVHIIKAAPPLEQLRTTVRSAILERLKPKPWGGLAAALLIGTRENLDGDLALSFRNAGLSHILALSGMHLAFLSAMVAFLLKRPLGKKGALIAGFVFIVCYVFLVGPQPSLVRSAIMYGMGCFLVLTGTARQSLVLLSAAFLMQIVWDPLSAYSLSFILSYLALAGILILSEPVLVLLRGWLPSYLALGLSASIGALLVTSPVVSAFFGILRPVGMVAAIIAVPLTGIFMFLSLAWLIFAKLPLIGLILDWLLSASQFALLKSISVFARFPGITANTLLVCIIIPFLIAFIFILANREARHRNELARFA